MQYLSVQSCSSHPVRVEVARSDSSLLFLQMFKELNPTGLQVYSPQGNASARTPYTGARIPSPFMVYLETKQYNRNFLNDTLNNEIYACGQFMLGKSRRLLLLRVPSQYSASKIEAFIWDDVLKKVTDVQTVADSFGDEGWFFAEESWFNDYNKDGKVDIVTRRKDIDTDLDDITRVVRKDQISVYINSGTKFVKTRFSVDTAGLVLKNWKW